MDRGPADTRERNRVIAARYRAGETQRAIAASYGISIMRVSQLLRAQGLDRSAGGAHVRAKLKSRPPSAA